MSSKIILPKFEEREVIASICKDDFYMFVREFWECIISEKPVWIWHIKYLCEELQAIAERVFRGEPKLYDLVINISPGTTKSSLASVMFPAWCWTRMPSCRIISASYAFSLAMDLARKSRDLIKSDKYRKCFPSIEIREDQGSKHYFVNTKGGDRYAAGVQGAILGMHAHIRVIDDPLDPNQSSSEAELKATNNWMNDYIPSRRVDRETTVLILIQQRLHENDPSGVMIERAKKFPDQVKIKHICLPAELPPLDKSNVTPPELRERYVDGLMDPVRLSKKVLDEFRTRGVYLYSSQFMQCLVGSTLISTNRGDIPIKGVVDDDLVFTRKGLKKVKWSGKTGETKNLCSVIFSSGKVIQGTSEHPIWAINRGWVSLGSIKRGDYVVSIPYIRGDKWIENQPSQRKLSASMESNISVLETRNTAKAVDLLETPFTEMYGGHIKEIFPLAMISITKMEMQVTIVLTIWKLLLKENIVNITQTILQNVENSLTQLGILVCLGTKPRREWSIIRRTVEKVLRDFGRKQNIKLTFVLNVKRNLLPDQIECKSIAPNYTKNKIGIENIQSNVLIAESHLPVQTVELSIAQEDVLPCTGVPVFDLTVEDEPEFFANGILVHNSPVPLGGGMFLVEYFNQRRKAAPYDCARVRFWDKASTSDGGNWTAGVLMGRDTDNNYYIENVVKGQWEPYQRNEKILATAHRDRVKYGPYNEPRIYIEREGGSAGRDAWKAIAKVLAGFPVYEGYITGDKEVRAMPLSAQLAAKNFYVIDDGTWDINSYISELCSFPFGRFDDQVDASSGCFNLLSNSRPSTGLRVLNIKHVKKKSGVCIIVCPKEKMSSLVLDKPTLQVSFKDPLDLEPITEPASKDKILSYLLIKCANLDIKEYQDKWENPAEPYNQPPSEILLDRDKGRSFWAFILKKREPYAEAFILQDDGDGIAVSVALALCDALRIPRKDSLVFADEPDNIIEEPPNKYIYDMIRSTRCLVI